MSTETIEPWREDIRRRIDSVINRAENELKHQLESLIGRKQPLIDADKERIGTLRAEIQVIQHRILAAENDLAAADSKCADLIEEIKRLSDTQYDLECRREVQRQAWMRAIPDIPSWVAEEKEPLEVMGSLRCYGFCGESLDKEMQREKEVAELTKRLDQTAAEELKMLLGKRDTKEPVRIPVEVKPTLFSPPPSNASSTIKKKILR